MHAKTEEFLNLLLWSAEMLAQPTFRNLTGSYEGWAYRNGLTKQIPRLVRHGLLEHSANAPADRLYRLTPQGRLHALGGRDPEEQWSRSWDGQWRLLIFDMPTSHDAQHKRLWRYLHDRGFGYLQNSVWIKPDPFIEERKIFAGGKINVESLILLEARPASGESDAEIVAGAWNFDLINRRYARHLKLLDEFPKAALRNEAAAKSLLRWAQAERDAWMDAVRFDPLLPRRILPSDYLGCQAWRRRTGILRDAGRTLRAFNLG